MLSFTLGVFRVFNANDFGGQNSGFAPSFMADKCDFTIGFKSIYPQQSGA
jgi:hypothetical protein